MPVTNGDRFIIGLVVLAFAFSFWFVPRTLSQTNNLWVKIYYQGKLHYQAALGLEKKVRVGGCLILLQKTRVRVVSSNCPKKLCLKQGFIKQAGQEIICLPHKVVITLVGAKTNPQIDAVVK